LQGTASRHVFELPGAVPLIDGLCQVTLDLLEHRGNVGSLLPSQLTVQLSCDDPSQVVKGWPHFEVHWEAKINSGGGTSVQPTVNARMTIAQIQMFELVRDIKFSFQQMKYQGQSHN
jgi:hypothetical protein